MSRAFVNEDQAAAQANAPVERRVSEQPNYVTPQGLLELQARLQQLLAQTPGENDAQRQADLRYITQRVQSAQVIPTQNTTGKVQIGSWVTFADEHDHTQRIALVGEDQADAAKGLINWGSPLGKALLGAKVGDEVRWQRPAGDVLIEIIEIAQQPA